MGIYYFPLSIGRGRNTHRVYEIYVFRVRVNYLAKIVKINYNNKEDSSKGLTLTKNTSAK